MSEAELRVFFEATKDPWPDRLHWAGRQDLYAWAHGANLSNRLKREPRKCSAEEREELRAWKRNYVSPKLARWIYDNLLPDPPLFEEDPWLDLRRSLLWKIALHKSNPSWKNGFFWREIEKNKTIRYGMWVVEAMSGFVGGIGDVPTFIALYGDEEACPEARGEALFALGYLARSDDPEWMEATHDVCLRALRDPDLPYARAGACCLATWTRRFIDEVSALREDQTVAIPGWGRTVGTYASEYYDEYMSYERE